MYVPMVQYTLSFSIVGENNMSIAVYIASLQYLVSIIIHLLYVFHIINTRWYIKNIKGKQLISKSKQNNIYIF